MSYKVLALKWRPKTFSDLVGQEHVVRALVNSLSAQRVHHAYLFAGTRGVGKTTIARILAKALNCEKGIVAEPCGVCSACVAIDEGRFVDLIEVDAASRTKVDDTRELLDNVQYAPSVGRFKVYLIDEVHMLSNHSFNALLKTLEEPPPHVKFLFATTDPEKLPVTVLSRCLQFNLKRLTLPLIEGRLKAIVDAEGIAADEGSLKSLARSADGSMRDGLSLLDQAVAYTGGSLDQGSIDKMLGTVDRSHVVSLLSALADQDGAGLLGAVEQLSEFSADFGAVLDNLMSLLQKVAVIQLVGPEAVDEEYRDILGPFATRFRAEDVQLYYQIALQGRRDLASLSDLRSGTEMTLLRMLAFRPVTEADQLPPEAPARVPSPTLEVVEKKTESPKPKAAAPSPQPTATTSAGSQDVPPGTPLAIDWFDLVPKLDLRGPARQLAEHAELGHYGERALTLRLAPGKENLNTNQIRTRLEKAIAQALDRAVRLNIEPGEGKDTPATRRLAREDQKMKAARTSLEGDPNVQALQETFGAVVEPDSIRPVD